MENNNPDTIPEKDKELLPCVKLTTHESLMVLPCPFCGSDHIMHFGTNGDSLYCRTCNAEGSGAISGTVEEAVEKWNTRTKEKES